MGIQYKLLFLEDVPLEFVVSLFSHVTLLHQCLSLLLCLMLHVLELFKIGGSLSLRLFLEHDLSVLLELVAPLLVALGDLRQ